ncbi:lipopolysaccharide biosynthesis protein [Mycobacterium antarcticum]|uniref:lipopolysaccharide biosynthesis protein n=1 Tax=Mycolicibacterium sp. TUM20984 TaxID=3023368 RepID=UPI0023866034|nr:lipopolysaccharide biosynthesis protein [Mycolicibacterium sp. TUM20984]GLP81894.1 hypothetical protein TUM20984_33140 [Mycolicibacterium sp. TUM20984]
MSGDATGAKAELRHSFLLRVGAAALGTVATFALTIVVVRTLDARDTATFFAILAALSIGSVVGRLGLGPNVIRLIPSEPDPAKRRLIAGAHLRATMILSAVSAPIVALFATWGLIGHGNFLPALLLTTIVIAIESVRMMLSDIFAAYGRVLASVATMHYVRSAMVVPVVALVALIVERPTLIDVLATYVGVAGFQLLAALWLARNDVAIFGPGGHISLRTAINSGTRLFSLELTAFMMISGTIWLANAAFPPETAIIYSAAATIAMQVTLLESLAALAVTPPAARLWAAGRRDEVVRLLSSLATINTVVVVLVVLAFAAFGDVALEIAYGPEMRGAVSLLVVLACGGIAQGALGVNISLLIICGRINEVSRTALGVLVVFLPCAVAAAFLGGPMQLAIVSTCGMVLLSVSEWLTARKYLEQAPHPRLNLVHAVKELVSERTRLRPAEEDVEEDGAADSAR